jgi:hypothetical protein
MAMAVGPKGPRSSQVFLRDVLAAGFLAFFDLAGRFLANSSERLIQFLEDSHV